jgi:hypothetical protein
MSRTAKPWERHDDTWRRMFTLREWQVGALVVAVKPAIPRAIDVLRLFAAGRPVAGRGSGIVSVRGWHHAVDAANPADLLLLSTLPTKPRLKPV